MTNGSLGLFRPGAREIVMGLPGTGKTHHATALVAHAWRCLFFSPVWEEHAVAGRAVVTVSELERYQGLLDDPHARLVIRTVEETDYGLASELSKVRNLVRNATKRKASPGGFTILCDEVGDYKIAGESILISMFRRSRHDNTAIVFVSQLATDFPFRVRKMASRCACFGQEHPRELSELASVYGQDYATAVAAWEPRTPPIEWRSRFFRGRWSDA